jgi:hypothetical protein
MGLVDDLIGRGLAGDALVKAVMKETGLDEPDAVTMIGVETDTAPTGDLEEVNDGE